MRPFITGISGFVGGHLAEHLAGRGMDAFGLSRHAERAGQVWRGDLLDRDSLRCALAAARPTHVFHCAAALGGNDSELLRRTNVAGTRALFEALSAEGLRPAVLIAGSSAVYGQPQYTPVDENHPLTPVDDYGRSKVEQETVAMSYAAELPVIVVRNFNLLGPRLSDLLGPSMLAKKVVIAERGGPHTIDVRNLDSGRDYTDVRDAVRAFAALAERGVPGTVYNVCSGSTHSVREVLDVLLGETREKIAVQPVPAPSKIDAQRGSFDRLRALTGWTPAIGFAQSLRDLLNDWRTKLP